MDEDQNNINPSQTDYTDNTKDTDAMLLPPENPATSQAQQQSNSSPSTDMIQNSSFSGSNLSSQDVLPASPTSEVSADQNMETLPRELPIDPRVEASAPQPPAAAPMSPPQPPASPLNQTQSESQPMSSSTPKKKKAMLIIIGIIVAVLAIGSGAFAYITYLNNQPEKVLADALVNTATESLKRVPTTTVSRVEWRPEESKAAFVVDFDTKSIDNKYQMAAKASFELEGTAFTFNANALYTEEKAIYVKFDELQETSRQFAVYYLKSRNAKETESNIAKVENYLKPIVDELNGQWIKISAQEANIAATAEQADACAEAFNSLRITENDKKKLKTLFNKHQFIVAKEEFDKTDIEGAKSFHYLIDFNENETKSFIRKAAKYESFKEIVSACKLEQSLEEANQNDEGENSQNKQNGQKDQDLPRVELWVNSRDRTINRVLVSAKEVNFEMSSNIKLNANDVEINEPTEFKTMKDVQQVITRVQGLIPL